MGNTTFEDLEMLENAKDLSYLSIDGTKVSDIQCLSKLKNIRSLSVGPILFNLESLLANIGEMSKLFLYSIPDVDGNAFKDTKIEDLSLYDCGLRNKQAVIESVGHVSWKDETSVCWTRETWTRLTKTSSTKIRSSCCLRLFCLFTLIVSL